MKAVVHKALINSERLKNLNIKG